MNALSYLSLFSGIGAFEKALDVLKIPYELVGYCEIDKYASKSYSAIHDVPETMNLGDITKIDEKALPKDIDLITYGFPCQDISLAGKQKGLFNEDGTQTRSGLFFEALRIIEETQPKVAIAENVKNLVGKKFNAQFQIVLASLEAAGYNNYWQVLNAKDYGIPQNRERVFIVSIRKDIDTGSFKFPEPFPLEARLKDMLEDEVDEKFYLSDKMKEYLITITEKNKARGNGNVYVPSDVEGCSKTITTKEGQRVKDNFIEEPEVKQIGNCCPTKTRDNPNQGRVYDTDGLSPCLNQMGGGNRQPFVAVAMRGRYNEEGKVEQNIEVSDREIANALTTVQKDSLVAEVVEAKIEVVGNYSPSGHDASRIVHPDGLAPTVKENHGTVTAIVEPQVNAVNPMPDGTCRTIKNQYYKTSRANFSRSSTFGATGASDGLRIRKLTPRECFRLMGFSDEDFAKAEAVNSNTQLYKQAGNSIVVDVIAHIFTQLKLTEYSV